MSDCRNTNHNQIAADNRGFSLVELIICVAILAIAIIPLYQSMTLSARTNARAQSLQNATSLAESVMEEIKTASIDELKARYNGTETNEEGKTVPKNVQLGLTETGFFGVAGSETTAATRATTSKNKAGSVDRLLTGDPGTPKAPFYVLYKHDAVSTQGEKFEVVATIRSSTYMVGTATNASNANIKKLPRIDEIDSLNQAVITTKEFSKYDKAALDFFQQNGASFDSSKKIAKKEIIIEKYDTVGALYDQVSVDCRVIYTDNSGHTYQRDLFSGTFGQPVKIEGGSTTRLPLASNIYLFYKRTQPKEYITITDNSTKGTHKVFLIKQDGTTIKHTEAEFTVVELKNDALGSILTLDANDDLDDNGNMKSGNYELVTNMTNTGSTDGHLYNEESRIRIYDIGVSLVKDGEEYVFLNSTKEVNDENK